MPKPRLLVCDTDALVQLLLTLQTTKKLLPLKILKEQYGIRAALVQEVEAELQWSRTFQGQFAPDVKKAIERGILMPLDKAAFAHYVTPGHLYATVFQSFQDRARRYAKLVQRGEAYTLAAAFTLGEPAISNDGNALEVLDLNGFELPSPVLRFFDLVVLCHQVGELSAHECDAVLAELATLEEHVPADFRKRSFGEGLKKFCPRIRDDQKPTIGAPPNPGPGYKAQISITRI